MSEEEPRDVPGLAVAISNCAYGQRDSVTLTPTECATLMPAVDTLMGADAPQAEAGDEWPPLLTIGLGVAALAESPHVVIGVINELLAHARVAQRRVEQERAQRLATENKAQEAFEKVWARLRALEQAPAGEEDGNADE